MRVSELELNKKEGEDKVAELSEEVHQKSQQAARFEELITEQMQQGKERLKSTSSFCPCPTTRPLVAQKSYTAGLEKST